MQRLSCRRSSTREYLLVTRLFSRLDSWRLFTAGLSIALVFLLVLIATSLFPIKIKTTFDLRNDDTKSSHDLVQFALDVTDHTPSSLTTDFTKTLASQASGGTREPSWWTIRKAIAHTAVSYFVCIVAMSLAGLLSFLLFRYLALPAPAERKAWLMLAFLLLTGLPAAILGWLLAFTSGPWRTALASLPFSANYIEFIAAELIILFCLVAGDGLAGIMLLQARALTSDDTFGQRVTAIWASTWMKDSILPLRGTAARLLWTEMYRRSFSSWSGLLSRFLLSEIALEFLLARLTNLPTTGVGTLLITSIVNGSRPYELAATAVILIFPLVLLRALTASELDDEN